MSGQDDRQQAQGRDPSPEEQEAMRKAAEDARKAREGK